MTAVARVMEDDVDNFAGADHYAPDKTSKWNRKPGGTRVQSPAEERIAALLQERIGSERYDMWFDRKTRLRVEGENVLAVEVANEFSANWIRSKFSADLRQAAAAVLDHAVELRICVVPNVTHTEELTPEYAAARTVWAAPSMADHSAAHGFFAAPAPSTINPKFTLEEFVVGPSNQMAYHAANLVAQDPGKQFNPLFIHGHCGLGKTHLVQGICQRFARLHPTRKWLYLTGEQFTNEFLESLRLHKTEAFRRRLRSADLLVIDDVHFLANKKATQEEFLHTFNQVDSCGKQVVLASDSAPKQIHSLSEQLSSRFVSGMVLRVDSPDLPTRLEILRRRVVRNGWKVSDAVIMHVAQSSTSSVRELEGLLLQVMAGMSLIDAGQISDTAGVLASIRQRTAMRGPVPVQRIVDAVAQHFSIEATAILGSSREKIFTVARSIAMYLARQHTGMSFPEIGRALGNKQHSTVIAACQRVENMMSAGELLAWCTQATEGGQAADARHQVISDVIHDLEAAIRKAR